MKALIYRYTLQARTVFLTCGLAMFGFMVLRVWSITLLGSEEFREIIKHFKDFEKFSPVPFSSLITYTGRVARTFNEPIVLFVILTWTISRGTDTVAGQINRGTMEMLLGNPVSRVRLYWSQFLVTTVGTFLLATLAWLGMVVSVHSNTVEEVIKPPSISIPYMPLEIPLSTAEPTILHKPMSDYVNVWHFIPALTVIFAMGIFVGGFATMISSIDRYRWRAVGISVGFVIFQQTLRILAISKPEYNYLLNFTFFNPFDPEGLVNVLTEDPEQFWQFWQYGLEGSLRLSALGCHSILMGFGILCYLIGSLVFCKRDLPAPI
ncbi:MAG: ABC transporter permease subunit [Planctomycetaceae bacterium]|nr:hypothetical protein [Planctomycetaceae bacterium]|tara:strand:+ start:2834 stop:3796 length:963 start_codon:yes stop_codon:yes gene_type:complete